MVNVDDDLSLLQCLIYYASAIGAFCGTVLISAMMVNIVKHLWCAKRSKERNHTVYALLIAYLLSSILICLTYLLVRSNIVTRLDVDRFTGIQCAIGYYFAVLFNLIQRTLLYSLVLYRLQIMFQHSMFSYSRSLLVSLFVVLVVQCALCMTLVIVSYSTDNLHEFDSFFGIDDEGNGVGMQWVLRMDRGTNLIYCAATNDSHWFSLVMRANVLVFELLFSCIACYLFVSRLWSLQQSLMKEYVDASMNLDLCGSGSDASEVEHNQQWQVDGARDGDGDGVITERGRASTLRLSIASIAREYSMNKNTKDSAQRKSVRTMIKLHELIKKKCILGSIALTSSALYWIISGLIFDAWATMIVWDVVVNSFCVWLMFSCSDKYWRMATNYCCCYCCYPKFQIS
mmetsp:Transcript_51799/g.85791  ORF Transcript_51799/g.85791 Transcript_51799/m.85791 type:complete len:400 (-) Transcript_51799:56-1255(-)